MKIPHYSPRSDFRGWLAWRLRVWSNQLEPERPRVIGPLGNDSEDSRVGWMVMRGTDCLAGFNTEPTPRFPIVERASVEERNAALLAQIFPERHSRKR